MGMLGVYNYTVILTYLGMLFSFLGMHFVFSTTNRSFILALLCLMIAGIMDMFDGKVASTKKNRTPAEKLFGIQIDSMADLISYGVFPALIVYKLALLQFGEDSTPLAKIAVIAVCALYLLCALIRLSYFNVDEMERQNQTNESRAEYRGLPVTSIALILPFVFIVSYFSKGANDPSQFVPYVPCTFLLAVMALLFILPFRMPKPHLVGKIILIIIGIAELVLVYKGKVYCYENNNGAGEPSVEEVLFENPTAKAPADTLAATPADTPAETTENGSN